MVWDYEKLRQRVCHYDTNEYSWDQLQPPANIYRRAAVLIPLFIKDGDIHVWLTKRSQHVGADKGHVAFPGGMADETDIDESATCLREAEEEIGLKSHQVEIIARQLPRINARNIYVTPLIGIVSEDFIPVPNEEVEVAFHVPLKRFISDEDHHFEKIKFTDIFMYLHFFSDEIENETITTWGLTATICVELAVALEQQETQFDFSSLGKLYPSDPYVQQKVVLERFCAKLARPPSLSKL